MNNDRCRLLVASSVSVDGSADASLETGVPLLLLPLEQNVAAVHLAPLAATHPVVSAAVAARDVDVVDDDDALDARRMLLEHNGVVVVVAPLVAPSAHLTGGVVHAVSEG